jgi:hypothetical protein
MAPRASEVAIWLASSKITRSNLGPPGGIRRANAAGVVSVHGFRFLTRPHVWERRDRSDSGRAGRFISRTSVPASAPGAGFARAWKAARRRPSARFASKHGSRSSASSPSRSIAANSGATAVPSAPLRSAMQSDQPRRLPTPSRHVRIRASRMASRAFSARAPKRRVVLGRSRGVISQS